MLYPWWIWRYIPSGQKIRTGVCCRARNGWNPKFWWVVKVENWLGLLGHSHKLTMRNKSRFSNLSLKYAKNTLISLEWQWVVNHWLTMGWPIWFGTLRFSASRFRFAHTSLNSKDTESYSRLHNHRWNIANFQANYVCWIEWYRFQSFDAINSYSSINIYSILLIRYIYVCLVAWTRLKYHLSLLIHRIDLCLVGRV